MTSSQENVGTVEIVDSMDAVAFDSDANRFRATFDGDRDAASLAVVAVVAVATNSDPVDLTPLHDAVDSSALDALFSRPATGNRGSVTFPYEGFELTVCGEGTIEACPRGTAYGDE